MECDGVAVAVVVVKMGRTQKREDERRGKDKSTSQEQNHVNNTNRMVTFPPSSQESYYYFQTTAKPQTPLHSVVHTQKRALGGDPMFGGAAIPTPTRSKLAVLFEGGRAFRDLPWSYTRQAAIQNDVSFVISFLFRL